MAKKATKLFKVIRYSREGSFEGNHSVGVSKAEAEEFIKSHENISREFVFIVEPME